KNRSPDLKPPNARISNYFGTIATKSRTVFCSGTENAPLSRANQKPLDDPPSRLRARDILKSSATWADARMSASSASEVSEQNPSAARFDLAIAAKVRRAARV